MDNATRHQRIARRFLISIIQQYGQAAPSVLRAWASEIEQLHCDVIVGEGDEHSHVGPTLRDRPCTRSS
jgi:hypothetical protein